MQTGTSGLPEANATPWTLFAYVSAMSPWQPPQVSETLVRGTVGRMTSCAPWQSTQKGALPPFARIW